MPAADGPLDQELGELGAAGRRIGGGCHRREVRFARQRRQRRSVMRLPIRFSTAAVAAVVGFVIAVVYIADRELSRSGGDRVLRTSLWCIAAVTLGVLTVSVLHERRLSRRVAERSAELERLSQELLQANRAKSEFLATVSHELRTPLNAIVGFVDLMRDGVYGELTPRQAAPVERIEASATHLRHLVDQILDLAKIAAGRVELHIEPVDLRPFILDVAADIEPLVNEKGLVLTLGVGGPLPRLRTDPTHLRQILVNLLGNAIKYTDAGGIDLRAHVVEASEVPATLHRPEPVTARITDSPVAAQARGGRGGPVCRDPRGRHRRRDRRPPPAADFRGVRADRRGANG